MKKNVFFQVAAFTATRTIINTLFRMVYPFSSEFGRGLGIEFSQVARALSWRSLPGLFGPFFASLADSRGRKTGMLLGVFLFSIGLMIVVFWPTYIGFVFMLIFTALGKFTFDPSMRAYLGDNVPYGRRGFIMAITEMGWSGAFLIGVPVVGFFINKWGWLSPFPLLAVLSVVMGMILFWIVPSDVPSKTKSNLFKHFRVVVSSPAAVASLVVVMFVSLANESVNLVFGVWLEDSFGLRVLALGVVTAMIGLAEFSGEGVVSAFADRLGKKRAVALGLTCNCLASLLLPVLGGSVVGALVGLFLFYLSFEFTYVSFIPMMTEVLPNARATLLALEVTSSALGRWVGALSTPSIYMIGFGASAVTAAVINLLALLALRYVVFEGDK